MVVVTLLWISLLKQYMLDFPHHLHIATVLDLLLLEFAERCWLHGLEIYENHCLCTLEQLRSLSRTLLW